MVFSSTLFLWVFLPIVLIVYYVIESFRFIGSETRLQAKNTVLLLASLFFYACGGIAYLLLLFLVLLINYVGGQRVAGGNKKNLVIVVILNLSLLFLFKYLNLFAMLIENLLLINHGYGPKSVLFGILTLKRTGTLSFIDVALPIGISFYIFQSISYVVDVYREKAKCQKSFLNFALYVSFFPQLIAGPIVQYNEVEDQLVHREEKIVSFATGVELFIYGLAKKVLIANTVAGIADEIFKLDVEGLGATLAWLGAICYTLQIYFDFSGYSDMAIGLARLFGFKFKRNFAYPYIASSIQDFWRRWHISLSSWFREYVYFPLGGSRCSLIKTLRNICIVFLLTGIWHGANFTFLAWGGIYALLLCIERLFLGKILQKNPLKVINHLYTMFAVIIAWVFFRSDNIVVAVRYIAEMFKQGTGQHNIFSFLSMKGIIAILLGIVLSFPVYPMWRDKIRNSRRARLVRCLETCLQALILLFSIIVIVSGSYNPFIYFQF